MQTRMKRRKPRRNGKHERIRAEAVVFVCSDLTASDVRLRNGWPLMPKKKPAPKKAVLKKWAAVPNQSREAATRAFNIDDKTEGRQTKKQKFTFKHEIPTKESTPCCTKNCSKKAILSWASNLNPGYYKNVCFDCQQDEIGGFSDGIDSIKTLAKSVANNSVIIETQV